MGNTSPISMTKQYNSIQNIELEKKSAQKNILLASRMTNSLYIIKLDRIWSILDAIFRYYLIELFLLQILTNQSRKFALFYRYSNDMLVIINKISLSCN